jgi:hypothetical protein
VNVHEWVGIQQQHITTFPEFQRTRFFLNANRAGGQNTSNYACSTIRPGLFGTKV